MTESFFYTRALTQDGLKQWQGKERQGQEVMSLVCFLSCGCSFRDTLGIVLLLLQSNVHHAILALSTMDPEYVLAPKVHNASGSGMNSSHSTGFQLCDCSHGCVPCKRVISPAFSCQVTIFCYEINGVGGELGSWKSCRTLPATLT